MNKAMADLGFRGVENNETYWIGCQRTGGLAEAVSREEYYLIAMACDGHVGRCSMELEKTGVFTPKYSHGAPLRNPSIKKLQ